MMASSNAPAAARYTPGSWLGVVRSGTVVLLPPDTSPVLVGSLWELLATGPEVHEVLDAVTSAAGVSLSRLPWFGIVDARNAMQVFLRGGIDLSVQLTAGPVELSGRDVTTWTERRFPKAAGFAVGIPAAASGPGGSDGSTLELPLGDGVVLLQGLRVDLSGSAAPEAAVALHTVAVPAAATTVAVALELAEAHVDAETDAEADAAETLLELPEEEPELPDEEPELPDEAPALPAEEPEPEASDSYDHLWEQTVIRNIEDAAVREDPDDDGEPGKEETESAPAPVPAPVPVPVPVPAPAPEPPAAPRPAVPTGLIDSVPWHTGGNDPASSSPRTAAAPLPPSVNPPPAALAVDHDGQTIMKTDLAGARPDPAGTAAAPRKDPDPGTGPMVLARVCPEGHANPSTYAQCGRCGLALPGDGVQVRRPRLGRMRLSTGELINLDQSLIVGRQPSVSRVQGAVMPRLVQVASPSGDISRSHVEVRLEGWHVMLCDLKATNGTVLIREGQPPRRLAQGEMAILLDGDIAEVGDGISLRFEEIP
jgi:hypothetical protein